MIFKEIPMIEDMTIEQIRERLQDVNILEVASATGVHWNTIYHIRAGKRKDIAMSVYKPLMEYFSREDNKNVDFPN